MTTAPARQPRQFIGDDARRLWNLTWVLAVTDWKPVRRKADIATCLVQNQDLHPSLGRHPDAVPDVLTQLARRGPLELLQ